MKRKKSIPGPTKKPARTFDAESGTVTMTMPGGERLTMAMIGLEVPVLYRLAMVGAVQLVQKRRNPAKAWALIQQGIFGRDTRGRRIPLAVRALAVLRKVSNEDAYLLWRKLSRDERQKVKRDAAIRAMCASLRAEKLAEQADNEPLAWLK